ncbi:MAG: hypothetical protein QXZ23_12660 [Saccharolobus sp.]
MLYNEQSLSKILYYLQRVGDHNINLLRELSGINNIEEILNILKNEYNLLLVPMPRFNRIGLEFFHTIVKLASRNIKPDNFHFFLNGLVIAALKDSITPNTLILDIVSPTGKWAFIDVLDKLCEKEIIEDYEIYMEYDRRVYPIDFSKFNFNTLQFDENFILDKPREPFSFPDLSDDFKPDWYDIMIIGKKQANPLRTWSIIGKDLGIGEDEVIYHYYNHVIDKGLIESFYTYLGKINFRITLLINEVNEEVARELTRIPTVIRISNLHNEKIYSTIIGQNHMLLGILKFINELSSNYKFTYEIYVHPITPQRDYVKVYSIPYEHFTKNGRWEIDSKELMYNLDKELTKL